MASNELLIPDARVDVEKAHELAGSSRARGKTSSILCPLDLCCCVPSPLRIFVPIPSTYTILQDLTHVLMLAGVVSGVMLVVEAVGGVCSDMHCRASRLPCAEELLTLASVLPCSCYINRLISMYDTELSAKEETARTHRKLLEDTYEAYTRRMEQQLMKVTQSCATQAERNFDDHRRDFHRFLEKASKKFSELDNVDLVMEQFRSFVKRWLLVFEECSVDPLEHPKKVLQPQEIDQCKTAVEVSNLVVPLLKASEVRFITKQRESDAKMLAVTRQERRSFERRHGNPFHDLQGRSDTSRVREIEMAPLPTSGGVARQQSDSASSKADAGGSTQFDEDHGHQHSLCGWCGCSSVGCGSRRSPAGYPFEIRVLCLRLVLLSQVHVALVLGLVSAVLLFVAEDVNGYRERQTMRLVSYGFYTLCICLLLARFEQIDTVQRLVVELAELEAENKRVQERHDSMLEFWTKTQGLVDLWVHRTMPRLNLYGEVHEHFQDAEPKDILDFMIRANVALEDVETLLPGLQYWQQNGGLADDAKKAFSARIQTLCLTDSLPTMLKGLEKEMKDGLLREEGALGPGLMKAPALPTSTK